jgi:hypothetical protein
MVYLLIFTIISGAIVSFIFFLIYKRHIKKFGTIQEKSFTMNAPKIFGSINILLSLVFGLWFIVNPSMFSSDIQMPKNKIILILSHIFFTYFYVFASPLSIASSVLSIITKKTLRKTTFLYTIIVNIIASILLFLLTFLILN